MDIAPQIDGPPEGPVRECATLCAAFQATVAESPDAVGLRTADGTVELTWTGYAERVRELAGGLAAAGVGRGDTVALMLANRPEALLVDTAALHLGAIPFSIYNTSTAEQIEYLFADAGCTVAVTERQFAGKVREARRALPRLRHVFVVDGACDGAAPLSELSDGSFDVEAAWRGVAAADVATLIYTSGTTGPPKGVELTHANVLFEIRSLLEAMRLPARPRLMSYLPMAHLADRVGGHYTAILTGGAITCVDDPRVAAGALPELRPDFWVGVPRAWEKFKAALEARFAAMPEARRAAIERALDAAIQRVRLEQEGCPVPDDLAAACVAADAEIFAGIREQLGLDQAVYLMTGAAPIPVEVIEFFLGLGLPLHEVWGLSESSSVATINRPGASRIGTVGRPLPGVEVKTAEDGELFVRGPLIMRGYRNQPAQTAEVVDAEGWLQTGDVGTIDDDGFVAIVDRKKELIITAGGKNMSPANIEATIKAASPLIGIAVAIGDRRPYNTALIVLEPEGLAAFAAEHGIDGGSAAALAADERVEHAVADAVERANARLSRVEQIKRYTIIPGEWLPGGDELTPTMKLKRRPIAEKYAGEIEAMYP